MSLDITALIKRNAARWAAMHVRPERLAEFDHVATRLWTPETKAAYQDIAAVVAVPGVPLIQVAAFIAIAHERESSANWARSLAQGDPLTARSVHVPAGRIPPPARPPFTFKQCAIDALVTLEHLDRWKDWTAGGMITRTELFNGEGYALRNLPSPYVFSGSDQYVRGKFVRDHVFDPNFVDVQLGTAPLLARIMFRDAELLATVTFPSGVPPAVFAPPAQVPPASHQTVEWLQGALNTLGQRQPYRDQMLSALARVDRKLPLAVDGDYGAATKAAVRGFQRGHGGLLDDGKAGDLTRVAIEKALAQPKTAG